MPIARQFHLDAQGSTQAQTGAAGSGSGIGGGIATFTFDAFGGALSQGNGNSGTGSGGSGDDGTGANPLRWLSGLGYWQGENGGGASSGDGDVGLTYVRQRWLDSGTGQWLSVDPVDSEPRYNYAHNSPTINTDVQGTQVDAAEDFANKHWRLYPRRPVDIVIDKAHVRHVSQAPVYPSRNSDGIDYALERLHAYDEANNHGLTIPFESLDAVELSEREWRLSEDRLRDIYYLAKEIVKLGRVGVYKSWGWGLSEYMEDWLVGRYGKLDVEHNVVQNPKHINLRAVIEGEPGLSSVVVEGMKDLSKRLIKGETKVSTNLQFTFPSLRELGVSNMLQLSPYFSVMHALGEYPPYANVFRLTAERVYDNHAHPELFLGNDRMMTTAQIYARKQARI